VSILQGWPEQYERMLRSHERLRSIAHGETNASSAEARDSLIHFFEDAYHLKDWIKEEALTRGVDVEEAINNSDELRLAADVCNGVKHFGSLRSPRTGDAETAVVGQGATVRPPVMGSDEPGRGTLHSWIVTSQGQTHDAVELASSVVTHWQSWLQTVGLTPPDPTN
jgi:hypothetical protein